MPYAEVDLYSVTKYLPAVRHQSNTTLPLLACKHHVTESSTFMNEEGLPMLPDGIDLGLAIIDNDTAWLPIRFSASQLGNKRLQP
jgi:hypothetical protein